MPEVAGGAPLARVVVASTLPAIDERWVRMVTRGRGSLAWVLGNAACRYRLFRNAIDWDRVLLAFHGEQAVGYAAFKHGRRGPFAPPVASFIAEFGAIMGRVRFALFRLSEWREGRYTCLLHGLRVEKAARRQGVATALIAELCRQAAALGAARLDLEVRRDNQPARQLYEKRGFVHSLPCWARGLPIIRLHRPLTGDAPQGWVGILSLWVAWKVLHLPGFLHAEGLPHWLWRRGRRKPEGLVGIAGIGYKQASNRARALCERWGVPYIALEDGMLRSSSLGVQGDTPLSMVVDPIGIHYLSQRPSLLEHLLQAPEQFTAAELATARGLIALMRDSGIGKYNHAPDLPEHDPLGRERPLVLVVDQTYGDFSIPGGALCEADFVRMLDAALAEHPQADVRVRIHPDCVAGYKKSCLLEAAHARGVPIESRVLSWSSLARRAQRVYVGTSQAGLEALILGVPVTCFGLPFYAGWGLTDDRQPLARRLARPTLEQLVAAAYIRYSRYIDPQTGQLTDVLTVARELARNKAEGIHANPQRLGWKTVSNFLRLMLGLKRL